MVIIPMVMCDPKILLSLLRLLKRSTPNLESAGTRIDTKSLWLKINGILKMIVENDGVTSYQEKLSFESRQPQVQLFGTESLQLY